MLLLKHPATTGAAKSERVYNIASCSTSSTSPTGSKERKKERKTIGAVCLAGWLAPCSYFLTELVHLHLFLCRLAWADRVYRLKHRFEF